MAIPIVPPKDRTLIISPLAVAMSSGGVDSCETVISKTSAMPIPQPMKTGYPQTCVELAFVAVAMHTKKRVKMINATNVAYRTFLVMAVYKPVTTEAIRAAEYPIATRPPATKTSFSYKTPI